MKYPEAADLTRAVMVEGVWWWKIESGEEPGTFVCERSCFEPVPERQTFHEDQFEVEV